jgi:3-methyladenine DNA glycosylase AlkC
VDPRSAFREIRTLAASDNWQKREVAATALVEISKKHADAVVTELLRWGRDQDANLRRAASEGLRDLARQRPEAVIGVLELLRSDPSLYVRKSVANVLRNAGKRHSKFVLDLCRRWAKASDAHTAWIIKDALRKLRETEPVQVERILDSLGRRSAK